MTEVNLTSFERYKPYILALEQQSRGVQRGFRKRLAAAIGCQSAFVTQVLSGPAHLSLEQGLRAAEHFGLRGEKQRLLMLMIEAARAGTPELQRYFNAQI